MTSALEVAKRFGEESLWFLARQAVYATIEDPLRTIGVVYLIDRFGYSGARLVARGTATIATSQLKLGVDLAKITMQELGPAAMPRNLLMPFSRLAPAGSGAALGTFSVGVLAGAALVVLVTGPEYSYQVWSDPDSGAHTTDKQGNLVTPPVFLSGGITF